MNKVTVIIETPKGSECKYSYDESLRQIKLKKLLPAGMVFPFDFGCIPGTKGGDGDPLDIIVISEFKSLAGCVMECRIIGAIKATQKEDGQKYVRNDRFIGIPEASVLYESISSFRALPKKILNE